MKIAVYTSCALNYYAKARSLLHSLQETTPGASLTLCLSDRLPDDIDPIAEGFTRVWTPPDLGYDPGWIFEHNIMELCTAVKGHALCRLMEEEPDADLYIYLDPDVFIYHDLALADRQLGDASIGLVPHITSREESDIGVQMTEMSVMAHGIYNLGHLLVRPDENGRALAKWWGERLDKYCFDDKEAGLFTDQRWMDLVPTIFDGVKIMRDPNLDVASWNVFGREITEEEHKGTSRFMVNRVPLITYHFSGMGKHGTHQKVRNIFDPGNGSLAEVERMYEASINANGQRALMNVRPHYDVFDNGAVISPDARRLYRKHAGLRENFPDPYNTAGESYFNWLRNQRPDLVFREKTHGPSIPQDRLSPAFDALFSPTFYLEQYPDVAESIANGIYANAADHYIRMGSAELRDPSPVFAASYYWDKVRFLFPAQPGSCDKPAKEDTLLWHYLEYGLPNGMEPSRHFSSAWYLTAYNDVADAVNSGSITSALAHFLAHGNAEGRAGSDGFDVEKFNTSHPHANAYQKLHPSVFARAKTSLSRRVKTAAGR